MIPLLLALLPLAGATQVSTRVVPCPMGEGFAKVFDRVGANASGGYDSDGASYASGGQWRAWRISTCDTNLFTLYGSDMGTPVAAKDRPKLTAALAAAVEKLPDRDEPEVWERYGIAAAMYGALGKDHVFLGDLWLEASWTARDAAVGYYEGLEGPAEARALLDAGKGELAKPLSAEDRARVLYNLVRVAHRGGYVAERDALLAKLEAEPLPAAHREKVARFRKLATEVEPRLQAAALAELEAALAGAPLADAERARVRYLAADLRRRLGRAPEALPVYRDVAADVAAPESLRDMARFLADDLARAR